MLERILGGKKDKKFNMKNLSQAKKLVGEWNKANDKRKLTYKKLNDLGLTDKMIGFLQDKPKVEIIEFKSNRIVYNTTEKVNPQCDWYGRGKQTMKALPNGKLQIEESFI